MKPKLFLAAILSTTAIASGVLLGSASPAKSACMYRKSMHHHQEHHKQAHWLRTPWAAAMTLPGIAIAGALSVGNRYYKG